MLNKAHALSLTVCGLLTVTTLAQAAEVEKFTIIDDDRSQSYPRVSGSRVVYNRNSGGLYTYDAHVDGYNITHETHFNVDADITKDFAPCISGRYVTWVKQVGTDSHIYARDVVSGALYPVCTESGSSRGVPQISGSMIVWYDGRDGKKAIYGYDLASPGEFVIVADNASGYSKMGLDGETLVWEDRRSGTRTDIYGYNFSTHSEFLVSDGVHSASNPDVSGNVAVFHSYRTSAPHPPGSNIYGYSIPANQEFVISNSLAWSNLPKIDGNIVVWSDARDGGDYNIYAKNLATGYELRVCGDSGIQRWCDISGDIVVWQDETVLYHNDIYGAKLNILSMFVPGTFDDGTMGLWVDSGGGTAQVIVDPHDAGNYCLGLQTGSPVTVTHDVSTPERAFYILFEYEFTTTSGMLTVELDGQLLETLNAPATLTGLFDAYSVAVWDPALLGLDNVALAFTLDETGGVPAGLMLDEIDFQTVPEPATLTLLATGMLSAAAGRRKRRSRP